MPDRRYFIKTAAITSGLLWAGSFPFQSFAVAGTPRHLTILYTGDVHGRILPFPNGTPFESLGGTDALAALIQQIRSQSPNVLLLDAGDMLQPSPDLDLASAKQVLGAMQNMGYDAAILGTCDVVNGMDFITNAMPSGFPLLVDNCQTQGVKILPWKVLNKMDVRVGVFAVNSHGLSRLKNTSELLESVQLTVDKLNMQHGCDFVICLSRLNEDAANVNIDDRTMALRTDGIDVVISGGTHTFEHEPTIVLNKNGKEMLITDAGWGGVKLGQLHYTFDSKYGSKLCNAQSVIVSKQTSL